MTAVMTAHRRPTDTFGLRLAMMRAELGLSLEEAAERCGLKPSTWATWEHGTRPRGMDKVVQQIANGLGYDRGWIMFGGPLTDTEPEPSGPDGTPTALGVSRSAWNGNSAARRGLTVLHGTRAA